MGDMGWLGKHNGELMKLLVENKFDLLITLDKGLEHQQNFAAYPVPIILLSVKNSRYEFLLPLVNQIHELISANLPASITKVIPH